MRGDIRKAFRAVDVVVAAVEEGMPVHSAGRYEAEACEAYGAVVVAAAAVAGEVSVHPAFAPSFHK